MIFLSPHLKGPAPSGIITDGLLHRWACDDGSGTTVADTGSGNYPGQINGPVWDSPGASGYANCLHFNGGAHYVSTGNINAGAGLSQFSLCMWYRHTSGGGRNLRYAFGQDGSGSNTGDASLRWSNINGVWEFFHQWSSRSITGPATPQDDTWFHSVVTYDGSTYYAYADSVQGSPHNFSGDTVWNNAFISKMGNDASPYAAACRMNDVRIYTRALSAAEVSQIYQGNG